MKKSLITIMLALGASSAMAVTPATFQGNVPVAPADCAMLASSVTLGASANVWGAYGCDEATNVVKVGACHIGGSRNVIEACAQIAGQDTIDDTSDDKYNYSWCDATNVGTIPDTADAADYNAFVVGSSGGTVAGTALGGKCTDGRLGAIGFWQ